MIFCLCIYIRVDKNELGNLPLLGSTSSIHLNMVLGLLMGQLSLALNLKRGALAGMAPEEG